MDKKIDTSPNPESRALTERLQAEMDRQQAAVAAARKAKEAGHVR
jgi:hypothetical protein